MPPPLVSVVIPCYRQGHLLAAAVGAVLAQTHPAVEVVVVNDGSDDDTDAVARGFGGRIRYVAQANGGLAAARNAGIRAAAGDWLLFLDADDLIHPEAVARLAAATAGRPDRLGVMGYRLFATDPQADPGTEHLPPAELTPAALARANFGPPHIYLSPRAAVERVGGFTRWPVACEDWDLWLRLVYDAKLEPVRVPWAGAYYRMTPGSMSSNRPRMDWTEALVLSRNAGWLRRRPDARALVGPGWRQEADRMAARAATYLFDATHAFRKRGDHRTALRVAWDAARRRPVRGRLPLEVAKTGLQLLRTALRPAAR